MVNSIEVVRVRAVLENIDAIHVFVSSPGLRLKAAAIMCAGIGDVCELTDQAAHGGVALLDQFCLHLFWLSLSEILGLRFFLNQFLWKNYVLKMFLGVNVSCCKTGLHGLDRLQSHKLVMVNLILKDVTLDLVEPV